jgi:hypothetical protein
MIAVLIVCQLSLADSLYAQRYYELAAVEYEREFFFYPELLNDQVKRLNYAVSLLKSNELKGIAEFNTVIDEFPDSDPKLKITMAKYYIQMENYYQAIQLLSETEEKRLLGFTYLLDNRLSTARNFFIEHGDDELARDIDAYINRPKKSIRTAALLSFMCPGAGEVYASNVKGGVRSFLLNLGSGVLLYNAIRKKKYVDAILIFNFLFQRFYLGSVFNAQKSALEWNKQNKEKWFNELENKYFQAEYFDY